MSPAQHRPIRRLLEAWKRRRFWRMYDRAYEPIMGHNTLHEAWIRGQSAITPKSLFSIGPGRGELELALCRHYGSKVGYAESFPPYRRALETNFARAGLSGEIVERHAGAYQKFTPTRSYDLILSVHSWYSFGYDIDILQRTLGMLSPGGSFILTVTAADDFFFRHALKQQGFSAEELSSRARQQGFEHELHYLRKPVPDAALVSGGGLTGEARGAISFLRGGFWQDIPRQERDLIEQYFIEAVKGDGVERSYGLLHFQR